MCALSWSWLSQRISLLSRQPRKEAAFGDLLGRGSDLCPSSAWTVMWLTQGLHGVLILRTLSVLVIICSSFLLCVRVFFLHVCLSTVCTQCLWRLEEGVRSTLELQMLVNRHMGVGNYTQVSGRAVCILNLWAVSVASVHIWNETEMAVHRVLCCCFPESFLLLLFLANGRKVFPCMEISYTVCSLTYPVNLTPLKFF